MQACMKLLHNQQVVDNLQVVLDSCKKKVAPTTKIKDVHKIYKQKRRTGREMWLTTQIGDYEMEKVILDLGSDANVLPK